MAPVTRSQVRKILKQRTGRTIAKDGTDVLISLDYNLFLEELVFESSKLAKKEGSREILPSHLLRVKEKVLKKYRG
ncbi:uncharacterized protein CYBJADRAFT_172897 [Cyberlindnera jadinii NRRL Y-1542]|uniref:Uncharacterized protein n=1 Tax=Cyberlindnera jadinii (strain ATCC 18201 / CBS 1600 / BCRC 20928 / JCM 3617 / NBRC 0987 / NRRL Y-1542) TaxID=983966 RepID=A0A1E4S1U3_CYBJN|nr:hypothetical protein CYBJADRAFT_172897 [Cyberlindnera jadinii NRRL Y-1542]ODV73484.1 hypothetical protein CYBJADRAFT_172897 [Cyberlindnera jadinii NRRL Y-1542]